MDIRDGIFNFVRRIRNFQKKYCKHIEHMSLTYKLIEKCYIFTVDCAFIVNYYPYISSLDGKLCAYAINNVQIREDEVNTKVFNRRLIRIFDFRPARFFFSIICGTFFVLDLCTNKHWKTRGLKIGNLAKKVDEESD